MSFRKVFTYSDFVDDYKTTSAVLYNLQIVGEGAGNVSLKTRKKHPEINWRAMKAFRNYVAQEYFGLNLKEVWKVIRKNLSTDLRNLRKVLLELESVEGKSKKK